MNAEPKHDGPAAFLDDLTQRREARTAAANDQGEAVPVEDRTVTIGRREANALEIARQGLRLPNLKRVVKHGTSNASYDLELEGGERLAVGSSGDLMNPRKVEAVVADGAEVAMDYFGLKQFREQGIADALLAIAEVSDTGSTEAEETRGWIASFTGDRAGGAIALAGSELANTLRYREPMFNGDDGCLYLQLDALVRHVTVHVGQRTTRRDAAARLGRLGFTKKQLTARQGDEVFKGRYWKAPVGFDPEDA